MKLSRHASTACFLFLASVWYFAFVNDIGNFWHGGTVLGLILTDATAILGLLILLDVLRSEAHLALKIAFAITGIPMAIFAAGSIFYTGGRLLSG